LKEKAYQYFHDTPLTVKGIIEAELLGNEWGEINDIELVVTSPLMRTLCTTENIFYNINVPVIVYDGIKEHPQSEEWCNLRSSKTVLIERFPDYDFSDLKTDNDTEWQRKRLPEEEEMKKLNERIEKFKRWIMARPEKKIAVVCHSSFLGKMMFGKIGDEKNELKHCKPYEYLLTI
jgi:broad specificity phosphatase PhoE|tara:strand:+ start:820 stop:1347 length:528 start_codon:yes stop_codon:yes gene_type:complete